jgi:hypothetical protein
LVNVERAKRIKESLERLRDTPEQVRRREEVRRQVQERGKASRSGSSNDDVSVLVPPTIQQGSSLDQNAYAAAFKGEVDVKDVTSGRLQSVQQVGVSGGTAAKLARESSNPQSIRDDLVYTARGKEIKDNTYKVNSLDPNINDTRRISNTNNNSLSSSSLDNNTSLFQKKEDDGFQKRIEESQARRDAFFNSEGFKRIDDTANFLTFGRGVPLKNRSFAGQTAQIVVQGGLSSGVGLGGQLVSTGETLAATSEGFFRNPKDTFKELGRGFGKLEKGSFSFLPGGTPINPEGSATLITAGVGAGVAYPNFKNNIFTRTALETSYPDKFLPVDSTGIKFIEGNTIPTSKADLVSLEGNQVKTIHVTTSDIYAGKSEFITTAQLNGAGGFRQNNMLLNFYKSSPELGGSPRAYLGYAGILGEGINPSSSSRVVYGKPTVRLLVFDDFVSPTPKNLGNVQNINAFQSSTSGRTFVPAENIAGASVEGQLITPSSYSQIPNSESFGLKDTTGSVIARTGDSKFTFYKKQLPNQDRLSKFYDEVTGRNYFKFELIPSETRAIEGLNSVKFGTSKARVIDLADYNSSYGNIRYSDVPVSSLVSGVRSNSSNVSGSRASSSAGSNSLGSSLFGSRVSSSPISSNTISPSDLVKSFSPKPSNPSSSRLNSSSPYSPNVGISSGLIYGRSGNPRNPIPNNTYRLSRLKFNNDTGVRYGIELRRFGKFRNVGFAKDLDEANKLGALQAKKTLGATYRIRGNGGFIDTVSAPIGFYRKGSNYIEKARYRLNTGSEVSEISFFNKRKGVRVGL